jgi:hypothetical protein
MRPVFIPRRKRPSRHTVAITCQVVRESDFRLIADRISNLSVNGALVTPADPVLTGERLIVSFRAPRWGVWIDTEATVARVVHGRRQGEYSRALGLVFDGLHPFARLALEHNLHWLPPVPPGQPRDARVCDIAYRSLIRLSGRTARSALA